MPLFARTIGALVLVAVCLFSRPLEAAERPCALGPVTYAGDIPDYFRAEIEQTLMGALEASQGQALELRVESCQQIDCLLEPARAAAIAAVLLVRIHRQDRDYRIELVAHAVDDGELLAQVSAECSVCGQQELLDMLPAELVRLRAKLLHALADRVQPPRLLVDGTPTGARVRIDGDELGTSPVRTEVDVGDHAIEISAPDYATQVHRWVAVADVEEVVRYQLEPLDPGRSTGVGLRAGGWVAAVLGAGGIGAGAALLAVDGREHAPTCTPALVDVNGACPNVYTTATAGGIALGLGVASLGVGIGLLVRGYRRSARSTRVQLTPSGLQLRL